jgi:hypothetical protein
MLRRLEKKQSFRAKSEQRSQDPCIFSAFVDGKMGALTAPHPAQAAGVSETWTEFLPMSS